METIINIIVAFGGGVTVTKLLGMWFGRQRAKSESAKLDSESESLAAVVLTTIFPVREPSIERLPFWSNETMAAVNEVNQYIGSLEAGNVMVFDTFALLVDGSGRLDRRYSEDGIHLNAAGYQVLNEALVRLLAS